MKIRNIRIGIRLSIGIGFIIALLLGLCVLLINTIKTTADLTEQLYRHPYAASTASLKIQSNIIAIHRSMKDIALARNAAEFAAAVARINSLETQTLEEFKILEERFLGNKSIIEDLNEDFVGWKPIRDEIISLTEKGKLEEVRKINTGSGAVYISTLDRNVQEVLTLTDGNAETFMADADQTIEKALITALILIGTSVIAAVFIAIILTRTISKPLTRFYESFSAGSQGNLSVRIGDSSKDEIGRLGGHMNDFLSQLSNRVKNIQDTGTNLMAVGHELAINMEQTAASSIQISSNVRTVKDRIADQSASITESSAAIEEVVSNIDSLGGLIETQSLNIGESSESIEQMVKNIGFATKNIAEVNRSFEDLKTASERGLEYIEKSNSIITEVSHESEGLKETNRIISNVASQTNLLAMNAAIEAAHAGEIGKGFAVVADEIRKLAESTTLQSKLIESRLNSVITLVENIVETSKITEEMFQHVNGLIETVSRLEKEVERLITEQNSESQVILDSLEKMSAISSSVNQGSKEMKIGSRQVFGEMKSLIDITEDVNRLIEGVAENTQEIDAVVTKVSRIGETNLEAVERINKELEIFKV